MTFCMVGALVHRKRCWARLPIAHTTTLTEDMPEDKRNKKRCIHIRREELLMTSSPHIRSIQIRQILPPPTSKSKFKMPFLSPQ